MFSTEQQLVDRIVSDFQSGSFLSGTSQRAIFTELNMGYGIADIVTVDVKNKLLDRQRFLEYHDVSLLHLIESNDDVSFEDIVYITKSSARKVNSSLELLLEEGLVKTRKGKYKSHRKYASVLSDSLAIEAKLHDWKRALKQAYRYKWFADKSFVFLPESNINPALKNLHLFKDHNVGLASVGECINVHFEPKKETPLSLNMHRLLNEKVLSCRVSVSELEGLEWITTSIGGNRN